MNLRRAYLFFLTFTLAALLALGGCKQGGTPQAGNQPPNEYGQPAGTPSSSMPGVQTQPSAQQPGYPEGAAESGAQTPGGGYEAQQAPTGASVPATVEIPAGTRLEVRLNNELGSKISQPGESFSATVTEDVVVGGTTVIARGARAQGKVIDAKPLGHFKGGARLALRLQEVNTAAGNTPVATSTVERLLKGKGKRSAEFIGGGAGLGAIIGGVAGGGKGAAIGALAGGGAGTAGAAATGNKQIVMPAGTVLTFRLQRSVRIGG